MSGMREEHIVTWSDLFDEMQLMQRQNFPKATPQSVLNHIKREIKELEEHPESIMDSEEWADLIHLAFHGSLLTSGDRFKQFVGVRRKLVKNRDEREWPEHPDGEGVYEHKK